jgi:hypothetical protein
MNLDNRIEYVATDAKRETIPYVLMTDRGGRVSEFVVSGTSAEQIAAGTRRTMDCVDCHWPAHTFFPSPERAVDSEMAQGGIPRELPFARREAVAALSAQYPDRAKARDAIARRLRDFYRGQAAADSRLVERAAASQDVWARNVFPAMNVSWGTYLSDKGHIDAPGCFRCHDDEHKTCDGRVISQDCELCHSIEWGSESRDACHGADRRGTDSAPTLGLTRKYPNGGLSRVIKMPIAKMSDGAMQPLNISYGELAALAADVTELK